MKRLKHFAFTVLVTLTTAMTASAYDFEVDGVCYNTLSAQDLTCEVTYKDYYRNSYSGDVVIPSYVTYSGKTLSVISIGKDAFRKCSGMTSLEIPSTVAYIDENAFYDCSGLASVRIADFAAWCETLFYSYESNPLYFAHDLYLNGELVTELVIPESVTSIERWAFIGCSSMTSVDIPSSVNMIGKEAFDDCSSLASVRISDLEAWCRIDFSAGYGSNPLELGHNLYLNDELVTELVIPTSFTSIGERVFSGCSSLTSLEIPNTVTSIGGWSFKDCSNLTSVNIPISVSSIGDCAFTGCSSLTSVVIPNSVSEIGLAVFNDCSNLTSVMVPNSIISIGNWAFWGCSSLTSLEIPNSVTSIGDRAFQGCSSLKSMVIGSSVKKLGDQAFQGCSSLKDIYSLPIIPPRISSSTFEGVSKMESIVRVPEDAVEAYTVAEYWKTFWNIIAFRGENGDGNPDARKCEAPEISLVEGKVMAKSSTENSKCYTSIISEDFKGVDGNEPIELTGVYTISSYAHAEGYQNSETVTAMLVWVNPTLEHSGILNMEAKKAVLIRSLGNGLQISGTKRGERIELYSVGGMSLGSVVADDGETVVPCNAQKGEVVVVKYGETSVKYRF